MKILRLPWPSVLPLVFLLSPKAAAGSFAPPLPETGASLTVQRSQDRILAEIRQIQSQLAGLTEAQAALARAVEELLDDREQQTAADRQSRAETRNALDRMERNVSTLSEAFVEANGRLSALMVEVESVREAQRRAALAAPLEVETAGGFEDGAEEASEAQAGAGEPAPVDSAAPVVLDEPSISEIYLQADADRLQGRYEIAISGFERVVEFGGELADNARYGIGDSLLAQGRLEAALEQFDILIQDFPTSNKIGEAWFQKGLIFGRLGHEADAREIFEDILEVYAGTPAARAAQRQLEAMPPGNPGS